MDRSGTLTKEDLRKYLNLFKHRGKFKNQSYDLSERLCKWECTFKGKEQEVLVQLAENFEELAFPNDIYREFLHDYFLYGTPQSRRAVNTLKKDRRVEKMKRAVGITKEMEQKAEAIMHEISEAS